MVCKECGKEITDETLGYCPECLAPLDEPVVINMSKDDIKKVSKDFDKKEKELQKKAEKISREERQTNKAARPKEDLHLNEKYEGEFINLIGYIKSLGKNLVSLLTLIGAVLLYISPFMTWLWESLHKVDKKSDLFDLAGKNVDFSVSSPILAVMGVVLLVSGFMMMLISAREYIRPMWKLRYNFIVRVIPIITSIVAFLVVYYNKNYNNALKSMKNLKTVAKSMNQSNVYSYGRGIGPVICLVGIVIYSVATLIDFIHYMKNKE